MPNNESNKITESGNADPSSESANKENEAYNNLSEGSESNQPAVESSSNSSASPQENPAVTSMRQNFISLFKNIQDKSHQNDDESFKYFNEHVPGMINNCLVANLVTYNMEIVKLIFSFLANYIRHRLAFLDSMTNNEFSVLLKILDPSFPLYLNLGNCFPLEVFQKFLKEEFDLDLLLNLKLNNSINPFYACLLTIIRQIDLLPILVSHLSSPLIDFERFYFLYASLNRLMSFYSDLGLETFIKLVTTVNDYYENLFSKNLVKELSKHHLEVFFQSNLTLDYNLLTAVDCIQTWSNQSQNLDISDVSKLMRKDLDMIYFLILSQNLERRVTGMKALQEIISAILMYEKNEKSEQNSFLSKYAGKKKMLVLDWLTQIDIFAILFGGNIHEAVLKKSAPVLIFLYVNDKLPLEQIDGIWRIAQEKHESIAAPILALFSDIISYFSIEHAMHILREVNDIPLKEVNEVAIRILQSLASNRNLTIQSNVEKQNMTSSNPDMKNTNINADVNLPSSYTDANVNSNNLNEKVIFEGDFETLINANPILNDQKEVNDFKTFYSKLLWKLCSENSFYSGLNSAMILKARKVMANILIKPAFKHELAKYVKKCIHGLNVNVQVTSHLSLLELIMKNMKLTPSDNLSAVLSAAFGNEVKDLRTFISFLEKQYSLTATVMHAIILVKKEVMSVAGEVAGMMNQVRQSSRVLSAAEIISNYEMKYALDDENMSCDKSKGEIKLCLKQDTKMTNCEINENVEQNLNTNNIQFKKTELTQKRKASGNIEDILMNNNNEKSTYFSTNVTSKFGSILNEETNINMQVEIGNINDLNSHGLNSNDINTQPLDETLSTEKSLDDSLSTISTDITNFEKSKIHLIREFLEQNPSLNFNSSPEATEATEAPEDYDLVCKKLKLNFSNMNYFSVLNSLLDFYRYLIFNSEIRPSQTAIDYLFSLLVENALDEEEMDAFYSFLAEIFRYQQMTKSIYITEEIFYFILFDLLLKIETASLPYSAFNLFKQIFFYINTFHDNITVTNQKITNVKDFKSLVGFESLWRFFLESKSAQILGDSSLMLVGVISFLAKNDSDSFLLVFEKIFSDLDDLYRNSDISADHYSTANKENLPSLNATIDRANRLFNLLFVVNNTKHKVESSVRVENVNLTIQNFYDNSGRKTILVLPSNTNIKELKTQIIDKVLCADFQSASDYRPIIDDSSLMLLSKGRILKKDKLTLRDLKIETGANIIVHKGETDSMEVDLPEPQIQMLIANVKMMFEDVEDEVIRRGLKRNNFNAEDAVMYLLDEANLASIRSEIVEENEVPIVDTGSITLFSEEKLSLLFLFLDLGVKEINCNVWQLLTAIKYPTSLLEMLVAGQVDFSQLFNLEKVNKSLLWLRLINALIFGDKFFTHVTRLGESKVSEWKMNILIDQGLEMMIDFAFSLVEKLNCNYSPFVEDIVEMLTIVSAWLHFFTFSSAISLSYSINKEKDSNHSSLAHLVKSVISKRPSGITVGVSNYIPKTANAVPSDSVTTPKHSSQATPTFGTPKSAYSDGKKSHPITKSFIGAEDYDTNYEEELCNTYFFKFISKNFHHCIMNYIHTVSNSSMGSVIGKEKLYLNLVEMLILVNEINPTALKEYLIQELKYSLTINLLFVEKSKFVRRTVENMFTILLEQNKVIDKIEILMETNSSENTLAYAVKQSENVLYTNTPIKDILTAHISNNYKRIYTSQVYEEFFNLFGSMLKYISSVDSSFNVKNLTEHILHVIHSLSLKPESELSELSTEQLSGNIYLFQCLCANSESVVVGCLESFRQGEKTDFLQFIYSNLFLLERLDGLRVRFRYTSKWLRQKAYDLLLTLAKLKEDYKFELAKLLISHHRSFRNEVTKEMDLDIAMRSSKEKFIGLRNYGCTCYLNSLVQQLYMIPAFRQAIYSIPVYEGKMEQSEISEEVQNKENKENNEQHINIEHNHLNSNTVIVNSQPNNQQNKIENNPVYQLGLLFAHLSYSVKAHHTPLHFIRSFKAFNNEPINVSVQQDCEEFLNILIDRLESVAKTYNLESVFDCIRSKMSYETISIEKDLPYYSETESSFLALNLDIKNKRSLEEALDSFVKGEILEGENKYHCETYDKKISITRRCSIKKLSKNVIINLKRFDFDYNTFEKVKLNDYCDFPMVLDFRPWMRSTILGKENPNLNEEERGLRDDPDAFKYKLTGVLVHSGSTADGGHYFSYVLDQRADTWHRYDDSRVTDFDVKLLKQECFGDDKENNTTFNKCQTAYLLFYTKIENAAIADESDMNYNSGLNEASLLPETILTTIEKDNTQFLKYKNFMDHDYYSFMKEFLEFSLLKSANVVKLTNREQSVTRQDAFNEEVYSQAVKLLKEERENVKSEDLVNDAAHGNIPSNLNLDEVLLSLEEEKVKQIVQTAFNKTKENFKNKKSTKNKDSPLSTQLEGDQLCTNFIKEPTRRRIIKLAIYYYLEIVIGQSDKYKINSFTNFLRELLDKDRVICAWLLKHLTEDSNLFLEYVLNNPCDEVRDGISKIIINCIIILFTEEGKYLRETFTTSAMNLEQLEGKDPNSPSLGYKCFFSNTITTFRSSIMRFFKNNILDLFDITRNFSANRAHQFYQIIYESFTTELFNLVELSYVQGLLSKIVLLLMNNRPGFGTNFPTMKTEPNSPLLIEIIGIMTLSVVTKGIHNVSKYSPYSTYQSMERNITPPYEWCMLLDKEVLVCTIMRKFHSDRVVKMLHHIGWGDLTLSVKIIQDVVTYIKENMRDVQGITNLLRNSIGLVEIDDHIRNNRIKTFFCLDDESEIENDSLFNYLMSYRDENPLSVLILLKLLGELISNDKVALNYVSNYTSKLVWIHYFIKDVNIDSNKRDNLQIEATTENYRFEDIINYLQGFYLNELKIKNLVNSPVRNYENKQDFDMELDFNKELSEEMSNEAGKTNYHNGGL